MKARLMLAALLALAGCAKPESDVLAGYGEAQYVYLGPMDGGRVATLNVKEGDVVKSGMVIAGDDGRRYDRFRERIMFPIRNLKGEVIAFGGRIMGKGEPKYLNSPETPLFHKGREIYGLFEGRSSIQQAGMVLVTEGYMDVVALAQHGIAHSVATLGTACTPEHVQKLFRFM